MLALVLLVSLSLFIVFSPSAQALRHAVFDGYQRVFPLERESAPVTVVLIDEESIARHGQWPWPRTLMAGLVEAIAAREPASIGLDMFFPERDRLSPDALAGELPGLPEEVAAKLRALPSNDSRFAAAIGGKRVVLGIAAQGQHDARFPAPPRAAPVASLGGALERIRVYPGHIGNVPLLDRAAASRGVINSGPLDQVVRMVPLVMSVQGVVVPSLGVESLRLAADSGMRIEPRGDGLISLAFAGARVTLQDDGNTWLRFSRHVPGQGSVSAADVMAGRVDPEMLKDKVVLVGMSGLGVQDHKTTPLGQFVPGVFIHAQVVDNLFNGVSLTRPESCAWIEAGALLAGGILLVLLVPRLSALRGINAALAIVVVFVVSGVVAFLQFHTLLDPVWPSIGIAAVFGSVVVGTLSEAEKQRRQLRDQTARMAGEVDAARRIQMGLLPDPSQTLSHDRRFQLAAELEPARTVGGDFYDCFMIDARRLFFVVADVSGKGLPAALFMAAAKSHIKSAALREREVGEALTRAQDEIARENPEQLFVTAFAAVLDVPSGQLDYANAGHEPPFAGVPHKAPERLGPPGGPPLCVVEDYVYPTQRRQLEPGEWLCVMTDGITEAMNRRREFFGLDRVRALLSWLPERAPPPEVVTRLRNEVARFADGAEAADDVTLLVLRWDGARPSGR